eukprot:1176228-Prorocentrum_minimum.AAC.2
MQTLRHVALNAYHGVDTEDVLRSLVASGQFDALVRLLDLQTGRVRQVQTRTFTHIQGGFGADSRTFRANSSGRERESKRE